MKINKESALMAGKVRSDQGYLTLGIPTILRHKEQYISQTITSLIDNMSDSDQREVTIVVFITDINNKDKNYTLFELKGRFQQYIDDGLLRIIGANRSFYPSFEFLKTPYSHSYEQVVWRTKQNYDYAFLFKYSDEISRFYMQLEDDVVTVPNFVEIIRGFISRQINPWACLEFSELGYIGKLYRSRDLERLAKLMILFYQEQPPDVTYLYFNNLRNQSHRIVHVPSIFQHLGFYSSLPGKIQKLRDNYFDLSKAHFGDNPPATFYTNFTSDCVFKPHFTYNESHGYFKVTNPTMYSYLLVVFDRPERLSRIVITTKYRLIKHAGLEVSPALKYKTNTSAVCAAFVHLTSFNRRGYIDYKHDLANDVQCFRVKMTRSQLGSIIFMQIAVFLTDRHAMPKIHSGHNPPAVFYTNLTVNRPYEPKLAYNNMHGFCWARWPAAYSYLLLVFVRPQNVKRIKVTTGLPVYRDDVLRDGILEVSPTFVSRTGKTAVCVDYVFAGRFDSDGNVDVDDISGILKSDVWCVRIVVTAKQKHNIVFREIAVFVFDT